MGMKHVLCITTGEIFPSIREAARKKEVLYHALYEKMQLGRCTVAGLEFEYTEREPDYKPDYSSQSKKDKDVAKYGAKAVVCLDDGEEFPSARSAAEYYGLYQCQVSNCCRGAQKTAGGKVFAYKGEEDKKRETLEQEPEDNPKDKLVMSLILHNVPDYYIARIFGRSTSTMKMQLKRIRGEVNMPDEWRMMTEYELEELCEFIGIIPVWRARRKTKSPSPHGEVKKYTLPLEEVWAKYGKPGESPTHPIGLRIGM